MKSRMMRWAENVARMGAENMNAIFILKLQGKRRLGRPRHEWEDNIRMDVREVQ
jgi:hypothetical protein